MKNKNVNNFEFEKALSYTAIRSWYDMMTANDGTWNISVNRHQQHGHWGFDFCNILFSIEMLKCNLFCQSIYGSIGWRVRPPLSFPLAYPNASHRTTFMENWQNHFFDDTDFHQFSAMWFVHRAIRFMCTTNAVIICFAHRAMNGRGRREGDRGRCVLCFALKRIMNSWSRNSQADGKWQQNTKRGM